MVFFTAHFFPYIHCIGMRLIFPYYSNWFSWWYFLWITYVTCARITTDVFMIIDVHYALIGAGTYAAPFWGLSCGCARIFSENLPHLINTELNWNFKIFSILNQKLLFRRTRIKFVNVYKSVWINDKSQFFYPVKNLNYIICFDRCRKQMQRHYKVFLKKCYLSPGWATKHYTSLYRRSKYT